MRKTRVIWGIFLFMAGIAAGVTGGILRRRKKRGRNVRTFVIGGVDGPTSVFVAGKLKSGKKDEERLLRQKKQRRKKGELKK